MRETERARGGKGEGEGGVEGKEKRTRRGVPSQNKLRLLSVCTGRTVSSLQTSQRTPSTCAVVSTLIYTLALPHKGERSVRSTV